MLPQGLTAPRSLGMDEELRGEPDCTVADAAAVTASQPAAHELTATAMEPTTSDTCAATMLPATSLADADLLQADQCLASQESGTVAPSSKVDSADVNHSSSPAAGSSQDAGCNHDGSGSHSSGTSPTCALIQPAACGMASEATAAASTVTECEAPAAMGAVTSALLHGAGNALFLSNIAMNEQSDGQATTSVSTQIQGSWRQSIEDFLSSWPCVCQVLDKDHSTRDQFVTALLGCLQQLHDGAIAPPREQLQQAEACRMDAVRQLS
jgi:hypothetical protein